MAAITFQYLNRTVNLSLPDSPLPDRLPKSASRWFIGVQDWAMRSGTSVAGAALDLPPEAPLPDEFA